MTDYLLYDGKKLFWKDGAKTVATFDATSGHGVELSDDGLEFLLGMGEHLTAVVRG